MTFGYTQPVISEELGGSGSRAAAERNVYAFGSRGRFLGEIDGVSVLALLTEFGSPLFVFSERTLRGHARRAREAFGSRYPRTSFAWSFKTNYLDAICQAFRQEGWIAEVVSDFEYEKARRLGFTGEEIVFNGPYKPRPILERAIAEGALVQIDNWDELALVEELVSVSERPVPVGLRVWLDAGVQPIWSKFGFALANRDAGRAAARVVANPKLRLHTLHTHIGTYILAPQAYGTAARKLLGLRQDISDTLGHVVPCLNLGGGFPSNSLLHGMAGPAEAQVPPIEAYAAAIADVLAGLPAAQQPLLRLETGRHLIDDAGYLLTRVVAVKGPLARAGANEDPVGRANKERAILGDEPQASYILDAGINLLYTAAWYRYSVMPARASAVPAVPSRLYGSLCMAIDVIRDRVALPPMEVGDALSLHPVGAYNVVQSMQFIQYRPAVVLIDPDGTPQLIRAREQLEDIERAEHLPAHLSPA